MLTHKIQIQDPFGPKAAPSFLYLVLHGRFHIDCHCSTISLIKGCQTVCEIHVIHYPTMERDISRCHGRHCNLCWDIDESCSLQQCCHVQTMTLFCHSLCDWVRHTEVAVRVMLFSLLLLGHSPISAMLSGRLILSTLLWEIVLPLTCM